VSVVASGDARQHGLVPATASSVEQPGHHRTSQRRAGRTAPHRHAHRIQRPARLRPPHQPTTVRRRPSRSRRQPEPRPTATHRQHGHPASPLTRTKACAPCRDAARCEVGEPAPTPLAAIHSVGFCAAGSSFQSTPIRRRVDLHPHRVVQRLLDAATATSPHASSPDRTSPTLCDRILPSWRAQHRCTGGRVMRSSTCALEQTRRLDSGQLDGGENEKPDPGGARPNRRRSRSGAVEPSRQPASLCTGTRRPPVADVVRMSGPGYRFQPVPGPIAVRVSGSESRAREAPNPAHPASVVVQPASQR
jgi:hypothetical protein